MVWMYFFSQDCAVQSCADAWCCSLHASAGRLGCCCPSSVQDSVPLALSVASVQRAYATSFRVCTLRRIAVFSCTLVTLLARAITHQVAGGFSEVQIGGLRCVVHTALDKLPCMCGAASQHVTFTHNQRQLSSSGHHQLLTLSMAQRSGLNAFLFTLYNRR
jgi:hypothetical protein